MRAPSAWTSLSATPTPAKMELAQPWPILGSATGMPSGTRSAASWWSDTATPTPSARMAATSFLHAMPQSTVTMKSGESFFTRSYAAAVSP